MREGERASKKWERSKHGEETGSAYGRKAGGRGQTRKTEGAQEGRARKKKTRGKMGQPSKKSQKGAFLSQKKTADGKKKGGAGKVKVANADRGKKGREKNPNVSVNSDVRTGAPGGGGEPVEGEKKSSPGKTVMEMRRKLLPGFEQT